jgi:hypothetical protein
LKILNVPKTTCSNRRHNLTALEITQEDTTNCVFRSKITRFIGSSSGTRSCVWTPLWRKINSRHPQPYVQGPVVQPLTNVKMVQSIKGICNFFQTHIKDYGIFATTFFQADSERLLI